MSLIYKAFFSLLKNMARLAIWYVLPAKTLLSTAGMTNEGDICRLWHPDGTSAHFVWIRLCARPCVWQEVFDLYKIYFHAQKSSMRSPARAAQAAWRCQLFRQRPAMASTAKFCTSSVDKSVRKDRDSILSHCFVTIYVRCANFRHYKISNSKITIAHKKFRTSSVDNFVRNRRRWTQSAWSIRLFPFCMQMGQYSFSFKIICLD